ncbi:hypothetical protein ACFQ46_07075 [Kineococcus sp. GCM10028916]|uniref:hypothetical protein n=1 Tax=Kineococcus sp. GCM10028916 TaxID=3273394 RepID=UPI003642ED79
MAREMVSHLPQAEAPPSVPVKFNKDGDEKKSNWRVPPEKLEALVGAAALTHPRVTFYEVAGSRVTTERLQELQVTVRDIARTHGFPQPMSKAAVSDFDREVALLLYRRMDILTADAADERVWSFLSLVLLPDVALWRYPNPEHRSDYERLIGRPRNVFRRLWWRTHVLGTAVTARIGEDQAVNIVERPRAFGDPRVARYVAQRLLDAIDASPGVKVDALFRDSAKRLLRLFTFVGASALSDDELVDLVDEVIDHSVRFLRAAEEAKSMEEATGRKEAKSKKGAKDGEEPEMDQHAESLPEELGEQLRDVDSSDTQAPIPPLQPEPSEPAPVQEPHRSESLFDLEADTATAASPSPVAPSEFSISTSPPSTRVVDEPSDEPTGGLLGAIRRRVRGRGR